MIRHQGMGPTHNYGSYLMITHPSVGLGWLLNAAASWLPFATGPVYTYLANYYYRARGIRDSCNIFEWFFVQTLYDVPYRIYRDRNWGLFPINIKIPAELVKQLRPLVKKHWRLRPEILAKAQQYVPEPQTTLGVHYRGTDKGSEVPLTDLSYLITLVAEVQATGFKQILLATDDERAVDALEKLPGLSYFTDHLRGRSDNSGIHGEFGGYRQAYETMIEILALGCCQHLVVGRSGVADAALILSQNDSLTWQYHN